MTQYDETIQRLDDMIRKQGNLKSHAFAAWAVGTVGIIVLMVVML